MQLKFTKDGKFRQFGFVGYETDQQALEAIKFFHKTFIKTSKISVEVCKDLNEASTKSEKHAFIDHDNQKTEKDQAKVTDKVKELLDKHKDDPLFKEFIETHTKSKAVWQNDGIPHEEETVKELKSIDISTNIEKLADKEITDKDYMKLLMKKKEKTKKPMVELYTIKLRNLPKNTKRQDVIKFFKPLKPHSVRIPGLKMRFAYAGFKTKADLDKALTKNRSFLNGKQVEVFDFSKMNKLPDDTKLDKTNESKKWIDQSKQMESAETICESGKLFFRNMSYSVNEGDLQKLFEPYGPVADISVPVDSTTRKIKGFGTVTFVMPEHAVKAYNDLNGSMFHGRMFHLLPAKIDDAQKEGDLDDEINYKLKKTKKLQKTAGSSHNWNSLFLGPNAVAEILAKNYDVTKEGVCIHFFIL